MKKIRQKDAINYINSKEVFDAGTFYSLYDYFYDNKGLAGERFYFIKSYQAIIGVIIDNNLIINSSFMTMTTRKHQALLKQSKYNIIEETNDFNIYNLTRDKKNLSLFRKKIKIEKDKEVLEGLLKDKTETKKTINKI